MNVVSNGIERHEDLNRLVSDYGTCQVSQQPLLLSDCMTYAI